MNAHEGHKKVSGLAAWREIVRFAWRYFSVWPLFRTLFKPFRRDVVLWRDADYTVPQKIIWNIFTRLFGALVRLFIITLGLVATIFAIFLFPIFLLPIKIDQTNLYHHRALGRDLAFGFTPFLKAHARDLSRASEAPLIGKKDVLRQAIRILGRERQKNILLVGEPGSGRTTLLEQLAKQILWGETLSQLQYRHMFELQVEGLSSEEMRRLMDEAARAGNIIVVIDNFHAYPELPDILLPYTRISGIQIIGVTTFAGYHQNLKFRTDLLQSFEKVELAEPPPEEVAVLLGALAAAKGIKLDPAVAEEIVRLTNELIHNVPQPEKSIDVLEELAVGERKIITKSDVHELLSEKTGVPVGELSAKERNVLLNLESLLRRYIVGQDRAVDAIADAMRRARSGLASKKRPVGSFLFIGPTGVGKTYTAQILASIYYGSFDSVVHFDMTEYGLKESLDSFIVHLVVATEENPFTLFLFDEIEKAHPAIINLFLQILEEGHISDQSGRKAFFQNSLIICTSNAGSDVLRRNPEIRRDELIDEIVRRNTFRPEFLNRFDGIVLFAPLSKDEAERIARLMLEEFTAEILKRKGISLYYSQEIVLKLAEKAQQSRFGAREIRRELQDTIESYLAEEIIKQNLGPGSSLTVPVELVAGQ